MQVEMETMVAEHQDCQAENAALATELQHMAVENQRVIGEVMGEVRSSQHGMAERGHVAPEHETSPTEATTLAAENERLVGENSLLFTRLDALEAKAVDIVHQVRA